VPVRLASVPHNAELTAILSYNCTGKPISMICDGGIW
jgi:hypothetical protein